MRLQSLLLLAVLLLFLMQAGCACTPLGPRTLPTGEDKYSAQYD